MMEALFKTIWIRFQNTFFFKKRYTYKQIGVEPSLIRNNVIYIVEEGTEAETLIFKCPCGCEAVIYLNLLKDTRPVWEYNFKRKRITITPSVWRTKGCKSHFIITRGEVIWV